MKTIKLTNNQKEVIELMRKYDPVVMDDGWFTGGHGIKVNMGSVNALKKLKLIDRGRLTELGKTINLQAVIKVLSVLLLLISGFTTQAQENYQQYNDVLERTEYFDSHGLMGYSTENTLINRTEYYDPSGNLVQVDQHDPVIRYDEVRNDKEEKIGTKEYDPVLNMYTLYDKDHNKIATYHWDEWIKAWIKE